MSKEQEELLDEVYGRYWNSIETSEYDGFGPTSIKFPTLMKEEFINKCKTDTEFSQKWGLQLEERELSLTERTEYKKKRDGIARTFAPYTYQMLDNSNIPTRLITITYNNETIESFK